MTSVLILLSYAVLMCLENQIRRDVIKLNDKQIGNDQYLMKTVPYAVLYTFLTLPQILFIVLTFYNDLISIKEPPIGVISTTEFIPVGFLYALLMATLLVPGLFYLVRQYLDRRDFLWVKRLRTFYIKPLLLIYMLLPLSVIFVFIYQVYEK